jgi:exo-beta-1,3-glucanase (GH17 family)
MASARGLILRLCLALIVWMVVAGCGSVGVGASQDPPSAAPRDTSLPVKACLLQNGLAYGPFRDGQAPSGPGHLLPFPNSDQIDEDLGFLSGITRNIRVYGSSGDYSQIGQLAKSHKPRFGVMQGIYLRWDPRKSKKQNEDENKAEVESAVSLAQRGLADSIIVGNETLSHSGSATVTDSQLPKEELVSYLRQVRKELTKSKIPVSTAQVYADWESNLDLVNEVDFVVAHFYPFWEAEPVPVEQAAAVVLKNYRKLKADLREKSGHDVEVVIGETGWPSGGEPRGDALPSPTNQHIFLVDFMTQACSNSIRFYYFSAFDEEWKWGEGGDKEWIRRYRRSRRDSELPHDQTFSGNWIGSSWGIFQSNGKLKTELAGLFDEPSPGSRANRDIFLSDLGRLSAYYDMGVDSDPDHIHDWLRSSSGELTMSYPRDQHWGSIFITVGEPRPSSRPWKDFSEFGTLSMEMRGERGDESVEIGIKNRTDPDNGHETRVVKSLTRNYRPYNFPLTEFASKTHLEVPRDLKQLYVVVEFVFHGPKSQTVYLRNVRYEPK